MPDVADIRERLARVEEKQNALGDAVDKGFDTLGKKIDGFEDRVRGVEIKSASYGTISGGVISVAIALITARLKGVV